MSKLYYSSWEDVPDQLKTKTGLRKIGLKPAPGQEPVAIKTHWHYSISDYDLYDMDEAVPRPKATKAQLAALEKANAQRKLNRHCFNCNYLFDEDDPRIQRTNPGEGESHYICFICRDHRKAIHWARHVLTKNTIILDTETTGLDDQAEIISIAIINLAGEALLDVLIKPTRPIPPNATAVHGLTDADVAKAPAWPVIDTRVFDLLNQADQIIIYGAEYDLRLIYQSRVAHKLAEPDVFGYWWDKEAGAHPERLAISGKVDCAMRWYAAFYGDYSNYHGSYTWKKLIDAANYFDLTTDGAHGALADCRMTLGIVKAMSKSSMKGDDE